MNLQPPSHWKANFGKGELTFYCTLIVTGNGQGSKDCKIICSQAMHSSELYTARPQNACHPGPARPCRTPLQDQDRRGACISGRHCRTRPGQSSLAFCRVACISGSNGTAPDRNSMVGNVTSYKAQPAKPHILHGMAMVMQGDILKSWLSLCCRQETACPGCLQSHTDPRGHVQVGEQQLAWPAPQLHSQFQRRSCQRDLRYVHAPPVTAQVLPSA